MAASRKRSSRPPRDDVPNAEKDTLRLSGERRGVREVPEVVGVNEEMQAMRREIRQLREEVDALRALVVQGRVSGAYRRRTEE